jgi:hypothetical protein
LRRLESADDSYACNAGGSLSNTLVALARLDSAAGGGGADLPLPVGLAGSVGGVTEALFLQPMDVVKTRLQLDTVARYRGIRDCLTQTAEQEGTKALWKGLTPFATHLSLKYMLRMGTNAVYQNALRDEHGLLVPARPKESQCLCSEQGSRRFPGAHRQSQSRARLPRLAPTQRLPSRSHLATAATRTEEPDHGREHDAADQQTEHEAGVLHRRSRIARDSSACHYQ